MFGHPVGSPFEYQGTTFTEAVSRLLYVVEQGAPFVVFSGASGSGRTTLLRTVESDCRRNGLSALTLNAAGLDQTSFLQQLSRSLCVYPTAAPSAVEAMSAIRDEVTGRSFCNHSTVLLIDDLDAAAAELHSPIRFLTSLNEATHGRLTVIATCRQGRATESSLAALQSLSALRVELPPLSETEAVEFASAFLAEVEFDPRQLTSDAEDFLVQFGQGNISRLARICEIVCLAAAADPQLVLDQEALQQLSNETLLQPIA